jgi:hypothetical protein
MKNGFYSNQCQFILCGFLIAAPALHTAYSSNIQHFTGQRLTIRPGLAWEG